MANRNRPQYAARLNAFKGAGEGTDTPTLLGLAASVEGITTVDLNFPDQVSGQNLAQVRAALSATGLNVNGLAMRYYGNPRFAIGAFTNPDEEVRREAIDLTRRGLDAAAELGGSQMTLWLGQDGFDYAFQLDYAQAWDRTIAAIAEIADHDPDMDIAIEYKPNEPRAFALMPDVGTTLLATKEIGRENVGVTLDFAHLLYADEMPAHSAYLVSRHSRLMGVHLNDGYGKRDDGLMVATVHPVATIELLVALIRLGYDGAIYFDTFPDHSGLDPVSEATSNVLIVERMWRQAAVLAENPELARAIEAQDAALSQRIIADAIYRP